MDVDDASSPSLQALLHQLVVFSKVVRVQWATEVVVDQPLPADGKTENIELDVVEEVLHLADTIRSTLYVGKFTLRCHLRIRGVSVWRTFEASGG